MIQLPVQQLVEEAVCFQDKVLQDQEEICNTAIIRHNPVVI